jgi:hypothetical protein
LNRQFLNPSGQQAYFLKPELAVHGKVETMFWLSMQNQAALPTIFFA